MRTGDEQLAYKIAAGTASILALFVMLPLWFYILFKVLGAVDIPGLMPVFYIYVVVRFLVAIVTLIKEVLDE